MILSEPDTKHDKGFAKVIRVEQPGFFVCFFVPAN